jgi:ABC-type Mn2+/Zn2+ transport system permease subunit/Mn-dependent DtxR family transcriptional regulator
MSNHWPELSEVFGYAYAQRALLASVLVGITCGLLGVFIVLRNMSLIGDALSHAILPGVVVGFMIAGHSIIAFFTGSVIAGLLAALSITWLQRNVKTKEDAAIGIVFSAMFALGIIGISAVTKQQGVHLDMKDFLFGNVLGISNQDLWLTGLITLYTLICLIVFYRYFFITTFQSVMAHTTGISANLLHYFLMMLLSFAVVASLQSVGVILVVAMLIIPASTALLLSNKLKLVLVLSALIGVASAASGLIAAIVWETTPGPAMTLAATLFYLLAMLFAPQKGLVVQQVRKWKRNRLHILEDTLKALVKLQEKGTTDLPNSAAHLGIGLTTLRQRLRAMAKRGWVEASQTSNILITANGLQRGYQLIRAHRLWESYLASEMKLNTHQIHRQAEQYEHSLPEHFLREVEAQLGYPVTDPHGSIIPQTGRTALTLSQVATGKTAMLLTEQHQTDTIRQLWELGITPNQKLLVQHMDAGQLQLKVGQKQVRLPKSLAEKTFVKIVDVN